MVNNNVIVILRSFDRKEMTRFIEFAHSPYFNKHDDVQNLANYLDKIYPDFTEKKCDRHVIFQELFPKKKHNQQKLAVIFTYTLRLLEQFLTVEKFVDRDDLNNILLLRQLRMRNLGDFYERNVRKQEKDLEKFPYRNLDYYNYRYQLAEEVDKYYSFYGGQEADQSIQVKQNNLDYYYLSEKLRDACEMLVRRRNLKADYRSVWLDTLFKQLGDNIEEYEDIPPVIVYYHIYQMNLYDNDTSYYYKLMQILPKYEDSFSREELQDIYNYPQNYCAEQFNKGNAEFINELFKLQKIQLEKDLLIENNYLSEWHYKNIVAVGLRLDETEWVYNFIETYKDRLQPGSVDNAYRFNLATYYYHTNQHEKVLDLLLHVEYTDIRYSLGAKTLLIQTYYALNEDEALFSLTDSFKQYVQRNKLISDFRKKGYYNFLKFTRRAFNIKNNLDLVTEEKSSREWIRLNRDIENAEAIFFRGWLQQELESIRDEISDDQLITQK